MRARERTGLHLAALSASALSLAAVFAAQGRIPRWIPPAPMTMLGVPSPLTGMTRSFVALMRGDLAGSLRWHPLGPVVFLACVLTVAWPFAPSLRRVLARLTGPGWRRALALVLTVAAITSAWVRQIIVLG